jgi:hypothetical protein
VHLAFTQHEIAELLPELRCFGNSFGNDVESAFDRCFYRWNFFLGIYEWLREVAGGLFAGLFPNVVGNRFQTTLESGTRFGLSLRFVWKVEIFELVPVVTGKNPCPEVLCQFARFLDCRQHGRAARFEIGIVLAPLIDVADFDFVEITRGFFSVSGNERNCSALFQEFDRDLDPRNRRANLFADSQQDIRVKHDVKLKM